MATQTPATEAPDEFDHVFATLSAGTDTVAGAAAGAEAGSGTDTVAGGAGLETVAGALPDPSTVGTDGTITADDTIQGGGGQDTIQGGTDTVAGGQGDTPKPGTSEPTAADFLREFREAVRKDAADKPAPQPRQEEPPAEITPFTQEELELIQQVQTEYPDVMRAVEAKATRMAQATVAHVFKQIAPVLEALGNTTATITATTHLDALKARVPDYAEVVPKVQAWIGQQPAYLRKAYEAVATNGNTSDVVDLIDRWRAASGTAQPAAAAAAAAKTPAPAAKPAPAKKDLAGLAPVGSKRTGVQADAIANDDYDSAFAAAERELAG